LRDQDGQESDLFQGAVLDNEPTEDKIIDTILIGIVGTLTVFFGGLLWLVIAGIVYLPLRKQENSWVYFVIPWIFLQIIGLALTGR
jgi:hypothetical protein